jgi:hypothetical protein
MAIKVLTPREREAQRLEREARAAKDQAERDAAERNMVAGLLIVAGVVLLIVALWFLVVMPGEEMVGLRTVVNLQRLYMGQTAGTVGAIFFATGLHLRNSR